jgi:hypothetical protein
MSAPIEDCIRTVRGLKVIVDADLARIYGVPTKVLNQAVKRNAERFPEDFCFQLSLTEARALARGASSPSTQSVDPQVSPASRSQTVTLKRGHNIKHRPRAFTEHGAIMVATVLNSPSAVKMSLYVVRAFIQQREILAGHAGILKKIAQHDAKLLKHDKALLALWQQLQLLLPGTPSVPAKPQIGFHVREEAARYKVRRRQAKT